MDYKLCVIFFLLGFAIPSSYPYRQYFFIASRMTWFNAQQYCRNHYQDLATFESMDDINRLKRPKGDTSLAWIGLNDDPSMWKQSLGDDTNSWRWSATDGETGKTTYSNWHLWQPDYWGGIEDCVITSSHGDWFDDHCLELKYFICYTEDHKAKTYTHISIGKSWTAAQAYCREHYKDLATIENAQENEQVAQIAFADAWIGLHRVPWKWSDNSSSSFKNMIHGRPDNFFWHQHCMAENDLHKWEDEECTDKFSFICQEERQERNGTTTMVKMKIRSDADITDPAVNTQILQQLEEELVRQGWTNVTLYWKTQPKKESQNTREALEEKCNNFN